MRPFDIPQHILDLAERLRTQDNLCTAHPAYCVQQLKFNGGLDAGINDNFHYMCADGEVPRSHWKRIRAAKERGWSKVTIGGDEYRLDELQEYCYIIEWETVMVALTRKGAEDYIDANGHNLRTYGEGPRIYVESFHRCREMIQLREWLMGLKP